MIKLTATDDFPKSPSAPEATEQLRSLGELGVTVNRRITKLQQMYLANTSSAGHVLLAQLRAGVGKAPGSIPSIWEITLADLPGSRLDTTAPVTPEEHASHISLTLYALHQQSRTDPMHTPGAGLGHAISRLAPRESPNRNAVRRRFDAAATATGLAESAYHLRGLIGQLRTARISLDYGQLADDLFWLQHLAGASRVRLRWARQYYHISETRTDSTTSTAKDES